MVGGFAVVGPPRVLELVGRVERRPGEHLCAFLLERRTLGLVAFGERVPLFVEDVVEARVPEERQEVVLGSHLAACVGDEDADQLRELVPLQSRRETEATDAVRKEAVADVVERGLGLPQGLVFRSEAVGPDLPCHRVAVRLDGARERGECEVEAAFDLLVAAAVLRARLHRLLEQEQGLPQRRDGGRGHRRDDVVDLGDLRLLVLARVRVFKLRRDLLGRGAPLGAHDHALERCDRRVEVDLHRACVGVTLVLVEIERAVDDRRELQRRPGHRTAQRACRPRGGIHHPFVVGLAFVDRLAREQIEERRPHRPEVGARIDLRPAAERLLGRHVARRAEDHAGAGALGGGVLPQARDAEVEHLYAPFRRPEQVVRLDVAVNDTLRVRRFEHREQLLADPDGLPGREPSADRVGAVGDGLALEQLHHEEGRALVVHLVVAHLDDPLVGRLVRDVRLAQEPLADARHGRVLRMQDLQRRGRSVTVRGRIYGRHPPDAEHPVEVPLVAKCRPHPRAAEVVEVVFRVFHRRGARSEQRGEQAKRRTAIPGGPAQA